MFAFTAKQRHAKNFAALKADMIAKLAIEDAQLPPLQEELNEVKQVLEVIITEVTYSLGNFEDLGQMRSDYEVSEDEYPISERRRRKTLVKLADGTVGRVRIMGIRLDANGLMQGRTTVFAINSTEVLALLDVVDGIVYQTIQYTSGPNHLTRVRRILESMEVTEA